MIMELKTAVKNVMGQLSNVIEQISDDDFKTPVPSLNNSTLGQHVRHTLEFFICLMDGYSEGYVNYDKRNHDKKIESDRILSSAVIERILEFIEMKGEDKEFILEASYNTEADTSQKVKSTFYRELAYNIEHAVHHMAIIKIGLKELCPYVKVPEGFGVAVSTIKYQKRQTEGIDS